MRSELPRPGVVQKGPPVFSWRGTPGFGISQFSREPGMHCAKISNRWRVRREARSKQFDKFDTHNMRNLLRAIEISTKIRPRRVPFEMGSRGEYHWNRNTTSGGQLFSKFHGPKHRHLASKCCFLIWLISYFRGEISLAAREGQLSAWRSCRSLSTHWARLCSPASAKRLTMARKAAIGEPGPSHLRTKLTPRVYSSASEGAKCDKSHR
jgi:hypothetical protein